MPEKPGEAVFRQYQAETQIIMRFSLIFAFNVKVI
jgi:hypothetical protein